MPLLTRKIIPAGVLLGLIVALTAGATPAQQPLPTLPPPGGAQPAQFAQAQPNPNQPGDENQEVLARGPVHEAFATTAEAPAASPVVAQAPPDPIEELPPEDKPEGDNVLWIPGYWHWDDDADRYIWISGFWRVAPPGRVWVPGSWRDVRGGHQWAAGFWQETAPQQAAQPAQQQPEIQYLPPPPESVEVGPTAPALTQTSFYVPGSWVWRGRYLWRPGFWIEHRPNWVWVPAHYRWSPLGYIFVEGYWDYPLATRGVLYAPVYFPRPVYAQPAFVYTPAYVVSEPAMVGALFVRRGFGAYYFGDYFAPRYANNGFNAWCGTFGGGGGGFAIGFGTGRAWGYDPLWSYYSVRNRQNAGWNRGVANLYGGRFNGTVPRPPVNLVQQNTVINKITNVTNVNNVTNNITVVNKNVTVNNTNVTDVAMLAPARMAKDLQPGVKVQPISAQVRRAEAAQAKEIRNVAVERRKLETEALAKAPVAPKGGAPAAPQTLKIDVPKTVVAKARIADEKKGPPANPLRDQKGAQKVDPNADRDDDNDPHPVFTPKNERKNDPNLNPKIDPKDLPNPKGNPKVDPNPKVNPKLDPKDDPEPKGNPKVNPKVDPNPKIDPKMNPKVDPKVNPKVDPLPKVNPKVDPEPKGNPKVDPLPKVNPKVGPKDDPEPKVVPKVNPNPNPKVDPLPKVEPKQPKLPPVVPQPQPQPQPMPQPVPQPKLPPVVPKQPVPQPQPQPVPQPQPKQPVPQPQPQPIPQPKQPVPLPKQPVVPKGEPKDNKKDGDPKSFAPPVNRAPVTRSQPVQPVRPLVTPVAQPQPAKLPVPVQPRQPVPVPKAQPRPQAAPVPKVQPRVQPAAPPKAAPVPKSQDRGNKGDRKRG